MRFRPLVLLAASVFVFDCATLDKLDGGACGNGVIDANEDCDSFPAAGDDPRAPQCGQPSEGALACRMKCASGGATCPPGWGCGESGYCRRPTGDLEPAGEPFSSGVKDLAVGDFDGDGRAEIAGTSGLGILDTTALRVHYLDASRGLSQIVGLPNTAVSPTIADLDGDGLSDVAFGVASPTNGFLGVLLGTKERTFAPALFPSFAYEDTVGQVVVVRPTRSALPTGASTAVLMLAKTGNFPAGLVSIAPEQGGTTLAQALGGDPDKIVGAATWGNVLDLALASSCGEIAWVIKADTGYVLSVLSPCETLPGGKSRWAGDGGKRQDVVRFPIAGGTPVRGPILVDVDHDHHEDIVVPLDTGAFVVRSDGRALTALGIDTKLKDGGLGNPVAGGDIDGDGYDDLVFERGVVLTKNPRPGNAVTGGSDAGVGADAGDGFDATLAGIEFFQQSPIASALVAHVNDDTFPDLVFFHAASPNVDVYTGADDVAGNRRFTHSTLTTSGVVQRIAVGDYDGDHLQDVAILTAGSSPDESLLSIAYGRAVGGPEQPRFIGKPRSVTGMTTLVVTESDATEAVGILSALPTTKQGKRTTAAFSAVIGSGDRQPIVPLLFVTPQQSKSRTQATTPAGWSPALFALGATTTSGARDIVSVNYGATATGVAAGLWIATANAEAPGGFNASAERLTMDAVPVLTSDRFGVLALLATSDLDRAPDGLAEIVLVANDGGHAVVSTSRGGGAFGDGVALDGTVAAGKGRLTMLDVDGDGFDDAVVLVAGADGANRTFVVWNDGKGKLGGPPVLVTVPPGPMGDAEIRGFALLTTRGADPSGKGRSEAELAVVTAHRLLLGKVDGRAFTFKEPPKVTTKVGFVDATAVAAGDFDGDGVPDLAIADNGSIRIVGQTPRLK